MLRSLKTLQEFSIEASDGRIGFVDELYFDDERWVVRFLVVDTGNWLSGRRVLISPFAVRDLNWMTKTVSLAITRQAVEESPDVDTRQPVSRQQEAAHHAYYGFPYYWHGTGLWGAGAYPTVVPFPEVAADLESEPPGSSTAGDEHLRGSKEVIGYHIQATDGELGHVEDFLVDDRTWAIRYMIVDTSNWWIGKKVPISPEWIGDVNWLDRKVSVELTRQSIKDAPAYDPDRELDRQWEADYYAHFGRPAYWDRPGDGRPGAPPSS